MHASRKTRPCGLELRLRVVRAGVANDDQFASPCIYSVLNQGSALITGHEVALASRSGDHEAFDAVFNLVLDVSIERFDVDLTTFSVGRLDGGDKPGLFHFFEVLSLLHALFA